MLVQHDAAKIHIRVSGSCWDTTFRGQPYYW